MKIYYNVCLLVFIVPQMWNYCKAQRKLNSVTLNKKAVGLILKANRKHYYVSSELCPGGIFLTRPVNENCLCYNGIFQIVRDCCSPSHTRIHSNNLEWRMDFKCGTMSGLDGTTDYRPLRAILPLTKPHNRFGSMIVPRSLFGNNTARWRKFDMEDIIVGNNAQIDMNGKAQFEIVNIKPLGREIRIMFGKSSEMIACYSGWLTDHGYQNLRVRVSKLGESKGCCFNITQADSTGGNEITASCSNGSIIAKVIDIDSADIDMGQCNQDTPQESLHTISKRNPYKTEEHSDDAYRESPLNYLDARSINDFLGDKGPILFKSKRQVPVTRRVPDETAFSLLESDLMKKREGDGTVVIPRKKGISKASLRDQSQAINEFIAVVRNNLSAEFKEPQTPRFQMLKKSFEIFLSVIPNEIVPNIMVKTAFDIFYFLYEELEPIIYKPVEMFNKTIECLNMCLQNEQMLSFSTTGCPQQIDEIIIDSNVNSKLEKYYKEKPEELTRVLDALKHVEIRRDKGFIPEEVDIYVEIIWKVADFVHSLCSDYFDKDFNTFTFYETELEALLLLDNVQKRWFAPRNDLRYVNGIFPVSDLELSMKQLDKVTAISHHLSRYNGSYWLERPKLTMDNASDRVPILRSTASVPNSESRLIFVENLLENAQVQSSDEMRRLYNGGSANIMSSGERSLKYPFQFTDELAPGELIWDGMAVCLHASYSDSKSYFVDSDMWGTDPDLLDLGQLYP